jgi:hypothetical protein
MADQQTSRPSPFSRPPSAPSPVIRPAAPSTIIAPPPSRTTSALDDQSLSRALLAGLAAAAVGGGLWALVTVITGYQIGWMAVGVGFLVGWAVRLAGKGTTTTFQALGAALALAGCLAGNLLTICIVAARQLSVSIPEMLSRLTPDVTVDLMWATFSPIDLLFYGLALYQGYRFSVVAPVADG